MLMIDTYVGPDSFGGLGLFAKSFVKKGTVIWSYNQQFDRFFTLDEHKKFDKDAKYIHTFPALMDGINGIVLSYDNDRYTNHSDAANVGCPNPALRNDIRTFTDIALDDITPGQELTYNYMDFIIPGINVDAYKRIETCLSFLL